MSKLLCRLAAQNPIEFQLHVKLFFFFEKELHVKLKYDKSDHICKYFLYIYKYICKHIKVHRIDFHHVTPNEVSSLKLIYFHMQLLARN